jgi:hypothetical protein
VQRSQRNMCERVGDVYSICTCRYLTQKMCLVSISQSCSSKTSSHATVIQIHEIKVRQYLLASSACVMGLRLPRSVSALRSVYSPNLRLFATSNLSHNHQDVLRQRRLPRLVRNQSRDTQWPTVLHTGTSSRLRHVETPQVRLWWLVLSFAVLRSPPDWSLHEQCVHSSKSVHPQWQVS